MWQNCDIENIWIKWHGNEIHAPHKRVNKKIAGAEEYAVSTIKKQHNRERNAEYQVEHV